MSDSTALVNMEAELEKQALAIAARVSAPSGDRIRVTQQKTFKFPDGHEEAGPIERVIVEFAAGNFYYTTPYVDGEITPPACFAIGLDANTLVPSPNSPEKQAETCAVCPQNQFKSAPNGRGKACRNSRILALLPLSADAETPLELLSLSPTAIKAFDDHASQIARVFKGPPMKAVSLIGFDPTASYATLRFGPPRPNPDLQQAFDRQAEARQRLLVEPDIAGMEAQAAAAPAPTKRAVPRGVVRGGIKR